METLLNFLFWAIVITVAIGSAYLYLKNAWNVILQIREGKDQPLQLVTIHFLLRVVGLFIWPFGVVMGLIPIKKVEVQDAVK